MRLIRMVFKKGYTPWNKGKKGISDITRQKKRLVMLGNKHRLGIPHDEVTKQKISKKLLGRRSPTLGIPLKKEHKEKIKNKLIGRVFTIEHRKNLSKSGKGRIFSDIHRSNLSKAQTKYLQTHPEVIEEIKKRMKGKPSPMSGKNHSKQTKELLSKLSTIQFQNPAMRELSRLNRRKIIVPVKDSKPEQMMQLALALHRIPFEKHKPLIGQPDIFIEPNICVFVDGDYWHANPNKYSAEKLIFGTYKAKDIWEKDLRIHHELNRLGYQVIRIWESDIKKNADNCALNIIKLIQELRGVTK